MNIQDPRYIDPEHTIVAATINGNEVSVSATTKNRHYRAMLDQGIAIADYVGPTLAEVRDSAIVDIDAQAEAERQKIITSGAGQAMSYQVKSEEAKDCLANHDAANPPADGVYPLLDSEVGVMENADGTVTADAYEVAVVVDTTRQAWLQAEAAINGVRVQAKADVRAATDAAAVDAALNAIVWP